MFLPEMTWKEVDELDRATVVVVPFGAMEQHSLHLPLETDALLATEVAQRRYREQSGIDAKGYALHAPLAMAYTHGLSKYANWPQCQAALGPRYTELMANRLSVSEYASFATKYIDDNLVRKS